MFIRILMILLVVVATSAAAPEAKAEKGPCLVSEYGRALDFWLGEWTVTDPAGETVYGENRIEKALMGCAIFEHWKSAGGGQGKSLFYLDLAKNRWEQIWVTEDTSRTGGLKYKIMQANVPEGSVRFQAELITPEGKKYLDRTTLTPRDDGAVRQHIEISQDDGATWQTGFDAVYRRKE